jgi:hypothetical protein
MIRFSVSIYYIYRAERFSGRKGEIGADVRKGIQNNLVDLLRLVSVRGHGVLA